MGYKFNPFTGQLDDAVTLTGSGSVAAAQDGTAALPGISFANDLNTGIYRPGANQLAISTGGGGRLFIDSLGKVGVGTTTPWQKLSVSTGSNSDAGSISISLGAVSDGSSRKALITKNTASPYEVTVATSDGGSSGALIFKRSSTEESARIDSSGRLLVGTPTWSGIDLLAVKGQAGAPTFSAQIAFGRGTFNPTVDQPVANLRFVDFSNDANHYASIECRTDGLGTSGTDTPGRLVFSTTADGASSPTEQLRITSDRYVRLASGTGGIQFNGDTAAANALDDYEEGTWSVALTGVTGSNVTGATYIKVGNVVHLKFTRVSTGTQTFTAGDPVEITGWPFNAAEKAGNIATTCVNVINQNASWAAVNQGIKMFNMVFERGGNTARLYDMSTGAVVTYGDLYLNPTATNPAIRGYVTANVT